MTDVTVRGGVVMATRGNVTDEEREYARACVAAVVPSGVPGPLLSVRIKLTLLTADMPRPALGQASLAVAWRLVRAIVAAPRVADLGDLLAARLAAQLRAAILRTPRPWPDPERVHRPEPAPLPAAYRTIVRHKAYQLAGCTPGQAALRMDALDNDIHVFTDIHTGRGAAVYRIGPTGYRLVRQACQLPPPADDMMPLSIDVRPVPVLSPGQAAARLGDTDLPHLFFTDADTGHVRVLYRRFDGQYGLVAAAT